MNILGLHLLLTYQCHLECDYCLAWGSLSTLRPAFDGRR